MVADERRECVPTTRADRPSADAKRTATLASIKLKQVCFDNMPSVTHNIGVRKCFLLF
jgi:hypothetical protein